MDVKKLVLGFFQVNCYVVSLGGANFIIDPGADAAGIISYLEEKKIIPGFIINTHGHYDHIGAVPEIVSLYGIDFFIHRLEEAVVADPVKNCSSFFGENNLSLRAYNLIDDNDLMRFRGLGLEIFETPGHTPGSITIKAGNFLFTGDLLFRGAIGRTDLPGGNPADMKRSLSMLKNLDRELVICPGHGPESNLGYEIDTNYYMKEDFTGF